jgi:hypothetical protein
MTTPTTQAQVTTSTWTIDPAHTLVGLTWNVALETGGVLVSDRVKMMLEAQAVGRPR